MATHEIHPAPSLNCQIIPSTSSSPYTTPILLVHSEFSSHLDFEFVAPILSKNYNLLVPDLPSHGISTSSTIPFNPRDTAALLADLISKNSPITGKAHVVGVSLGGYSSLFLAALYPNVVDTLFVTGCGHVVIEPTLGYILESAISGAIFPTITAIIAWLPRSWYTCFYALRGMRAPEGLQEAQRAATRWNLGRSLAQGLWSGQFTPQLVERITARSAVCAGDLDDGLPNTKQMGKILMRGNEASIAVKAKYMKHVWCLQDEGLFARAVVGWIERAEVVEGLEKL